MRSVGRFLLHRTRAAARIAAHRPPLPLPARMSAILAAAAPGAALIAAHRAGTGSFPASPRHPSLLHYGVAVLSTPHHVAKATLTAEAAHFYSEGVLPLRPPVDAAVAAAAAAAASISNANSNLSSAWPVPPERPARPEHLQVVEPRLMPPARKGVEHHGFNKMRLIHSLAHIESYAIDLSWDVLVRFATPSGEGSEKTEGIPLPKEFFEDWLRVANEEAKHFSIWNARLEELDSSYGATVVHEALWSSALETHHSLLARLAVVHCVHEARGLDQAPRMLQQLQTYGDKESMRLLEIIEADELTHVSSGLRWFKYICSQAGLDAIPEFHRIVRANFRGSLLPPFNTEARTKCGFTEEWYLPLAVKKDKPVPAAAAAEPAAVTAAASEPSAPAAPAASASAEPAAASASSEPACAAASASSASQA